MEIPHKRARNSGINGSHQVIEEPQCFPANQARGTDVCESASQEVGLDRLPKNSQETQSDLVNTGKHSLLSCGNLLLGLLPSPS